MAKRRKRKGLKGPCEDAILEARRALAEAKTPAQRRAAQKFMQQVKNRCGTRGLGNPRRIDPAAWGPNGYGGRCRFVTYGNVGTHMEPLDEYPASAEGWDDAVTAAAALKDTHGSSYVSINCDYSGEPRAVKLVEWDHYKRGAVSRRGWTRQPATAPIAGLKGYAVNTTYGNDECPSEGIITEDRVFRILDCRGQEETDPDYAYPRWTVLERRLLDAEERANPEDVVADMDEHFTEILETDDDDEFFALRERLLALDGLKR